MSAFQNNDFIMMFLGCLAYNTQGLEIKYENNQVIAIAGLVNIKSIKEIKSPPDVLVVFLTASEV